MRPKVPRCAPTALHTEADDILDITAELVRIHRTDGPRPYPWNAMRPVGPLSGMRWDHHPLTPPASARPGHGSCAILYTATDLSTALAEVYQSTRIVSLTAGRPHLTIWTPTRPLRLLDLTGSWPIRNGASHALNSAPRSTCRAWARGIHAQLPAIDGLYALSTMTGLPCIVLWEPAADSFPNHPTFSRSLEDIALDVDDAVEQIGYTLVL